MDFFSQIDEMVGGNELLYSSSVFESTASSIAPDEVAPRVKVETQANFVYEDFKLIPQRFYVEFVAPGYKTEDQTSNNALINRYQKYWLNIRDSSPEPRANISVLFTLSFMDDISDQKALAYWQTWASTHENAARSCLQTFEIEASDEKKIKPNASLLSIPGNVVSALEVRLLQCHENSLNIRFNCLSSDFSHAKGVKGIPLKLDIMISSVVEGDRFQCVQYQTSVLVFRDKGADRKFRDIVKKSDKLNVLPHEFTELMKISDMTLTKQDYEKLRNDKIVKCIFPVMVPAIQSSTPGFPSPISPQRQDIDTIAIERKRYKTGPAVFVRIWTHGPVGLLEALKRLNVQVADIIVPTWQKHEILHVYYPIYYSNEVAAKDILQQELMLTKRMVFLRHVRRDLLIDWSEGDVKFAFLNNIALDLVLISFANRDQLGIFGAIISIDV